METDRPAPREPFGRLLKRLRLAALSLDQLAARLDNRFRLLTAGSRTALPRQQTLCATLDWSYELLSGPKQRLLPRLVVFAGGWTLEAAEAVCAGEATWLQERHLECGVAPGAGQAGRAAYSRNCGWRVWRPS